MIGDTDLYMFPCKWQGRMLQHVPPHHLLNCYGDGCYKGRSIEVCGKKFDLQEVHEYVERNYVRLQKKMYGEEVFVPCRVDDTYR